MEPVNFIFTTLRLFLIIKKTQITLVPCPSKCDLIIEMKAKNSSENLAKNLDILG